MIRSQRPAAARSTILPPVGRRSLQSPVATTMRPVTPDYVSQMPRDQRERNVDNPAHRAVAEPNTVLLGLVGSTVHGVTVDGADDRDEMGICIEPPEYV